MEFSSASDLLNPKMSLSKNGKLDDLTRTSTRPWALLYAPTFLKYTYAICLPFGETDFWIWISLIASPRANMPPKVNGGMNNKMPASTDNPPPMREGRRVVISSLLSLLRVMARNREAVASSKTKRGEII